MKKIVCLTGPSGVGKSFYAKKLIGCCGFVQAITVTSRLPRADDEFHQYVDKEAFVKMIKENKLIEWASYNGNLYGTSFEDFESLKASNYSGIVLDLRPESCLVIKEFFKDTIIIGLLPKDIKILEKRLLSRGTNTVEEIEKRMKLCRDDINKIEQMNFPTVYCSYDPSLSEATFNGILDLIK